MFEIKSKYKKGKNINKLKIFIHKILNKNRSIRKEDKINYNREERINMIKSKLEDIEKSVLTYK